MFFHCWSRLARISLINNCSIWLEVVWCSRTLQLNGILGLIKIARCNYRWISLEFNTEPLFALICKCALLSIEGILCLHQYFMINQSISFIKLFIQFCLCLILKKCLIKEVCCFSLAELVKTHVRKILHILHQKGSTGDIRGTHVTTVKFFIFVLPRNHVLF